MLFAPIGIFIGDMEGGGVMMNDAFYEIWGARAPTPDSVEEYCEYKGWFVDTDRKITSEEWAGARALKGESVTNIVDIHRFDAGEER